MKKILSCIVALLLIISAIPFAASAADGAAITVSNASNCPGKEVTVTVYLQNTETGIAGLDVTLVYDSTVLTCTSDSEIEGALGSLNVFVNTGNAGRVKIICDAYKNVTTSGTLVTLTFEINENAKGSTMISIDKVVAGDNVGNSISVASGSGTVTVGHSMKETKAQVPATCTTPGTTAVMGCERCDYTEGGVETPALGHTELVEKAAAVAATCTAPGKTAVMGCERCDYTEGGVEIAALDHTPAEAVKENEVAATCTKEGSYDSVVYCSVCNAEISRETMTIPVAGHTDADNNKRCDVCGANLCINHQFTTSVFPQIPATCGTDGTAISMTYCTVCNWTLSQVTIVIPATGAHTPGAEVKENEVAATCGTSGSYDTVCYCTVCNKELSRTSVTVPATDKHVDDNSDHACDNCGKVLSECVDLDPVDGKCDICGKKIGDCVDNDNDHKCDVCGAVLSECVDDNNDHNCDICGKTLSECADLDPVDGKCDICGKKIGDCVDNDNDHKCDVCGAVLSECADENKDHNCDVCGKVLSECADENKDHACDLCGKTLSECVYDNACDADCNICGAVRVPADHVYDDDNDTTCNVCGYERVIEPAPTGDSAVALIVLATAVLTVGAAAVIIKKKRED